MAINKDTLAQMQQLAKFTPEQVDGMLQELATTDPETWRKAINILFLTLWTNHASTRNGAQALSHHVKAVKGDVDKVMEFLKSVQAGATAPDVATDETDADVQAPPMTPPAAVVGGGPVAPRIGADGHPLSENDAAVESMMDQVAGPRGQSAPQQQRPAPQRAVRGMPPIARQGNGGASQRNGNDGTPLSPEEAEIEGMMDAATNGQS